MRINADLIVKLRKEKSWSQNDLAIASDLNIRTIQRMEKEASASLKTRKALASALEINIETLESEENIMKPCPICKSDEVYHYKHYFQSSSFGEELLPKLGKGLLRSATICPYVCANCGFVRLIASNAVSYTHLTLPTKRIV